MLVLIVENEPLVAVSLEQELELAGHRVLGPAADPDDGLRLAEEHRPDVALVDIGLNGVPRGIELARALRSKYDVAVLFVTMTLDAALENQDAAVGVITKPFDPDDVPESVEIVNAVKQGKRPIPQSIPGSLQLFSAFSAREQAPRHKFAAAELRTADGSLI
jgi:DNA-binding NarL/FixJ family response regulator